MLPTGSSPGSRTFMVAWPVTRALETWQMKVLLIDSSEDWSRSLVPWDSV